MICHSFEPATLTTVHCPHAMLTSSFVLKLSPGKILPVGGRAGRAARAVRLQVQR